MSALLYQHPLAFLVGLEGVALMRAFAGEHDEAFTRARLAETKALLDDAARWGEGVTLPALSVADGYDAWAPRYDSPDNAIFAVEESVVWPLLDSLPPGDALDVACGTGRHAGRLASLGHRVAASTPLRACSRSPGATCQGSGSPSATCTRCRWRTRRSTW